MEKKLLNITDYRQERIFDWSFEDGDRLFTIEGLDDPDYFDHLREAQTWIDEKIRDEKIEAAKKLNKKGEEKTMEKFATIKEIRDAMTSQLEHGFKAVGLKTLIDDMEELEQGKIMRGNYEYQRDNSFCKCGKHIGPLVEVGVEEICSKCLREEEQEKKDKERIIKLNKNWHKLLDELNAIKKVYKLKLGDPREDGSERITGIDRNSDKHYCRIFRDTIWGSSSWRSTGRSALRIDTDDYDIKANKTQKDFGGKDLAKNLDKKCDGFFETFEARDKRRTEKKKKENHVENCVKKHFPGVKEIENDGRYDHRRRYTFTGAVKFKHAYTHIKTYDGEKYYVGGIAGDYTHKEVGEINLAIAKIIEKREKKVVKKTNKK